MHVLVMKKSGGPKRATIAIALRKSTAIARREPRSVLGQTTVLPTLCRSVPSATALASAPYSSARSAVWPAGERTHAIRHPSARAACVATYCWSSRPARNRCSLARLPAAMRSLSAVLGTMNRTSQQLHSRTCMLRVPSSQSPGTAWSATTQVPALCSSTWIVRESCVYSGHAAPLMAIARSLALGRAASCQR